MTQQDQLPSSAGATGSSSLAFLISIAWWQKALRIAVAFAPNCMLPALSLSLANVVILVGMHIVYGAIRQPQIDVDDLVRAAFIGVAGAVAGLVLSCWALGFWLLRLTAFSRAWFSDSEVDKKQFSESIAETRRRAGYLAKLWLVASIFLLVPVVPLCVAISLNVLGSPDYIGARALSVALPGWVPAASTAALVMLTVVATSYSLVTLVVSSISALPPQHAAIEALKLSAQHWLSVLVITIVMLLINCLITTPQALLSATTLAEVKGTPLFVGIGLQLWMALTSAVLWPLSIIPFCELLRDKVK